METRWFAGTHGCYGSLNKMKKVYEGNNKGNKMSKLRTLSLFALLAMIVGFTGISPARVAQAASITNNGSPTMFQENFNSNTLGANLQQLVGNPVGLSGGNVNLGGHWNIVPHASIGTTEANYHTVDFVAQVSVIAHDQSACADEIYFGLGKGTPVHSKLPGARRASC